MPETHGAYFPPPPRGRLDRLGRAMWARHANPLSGWSRVALGMLLPAAIWSRDWTLIGAMVVLLATNPFWFPPPAARSAFMYHGVRGERLWIRDGKAGPLRSQARFMALIALASVWLIWERSWLGVGLYGVAIAWKFWFIVRIAAYSRARPSAPFP